MAQIDFIQTLHSTTKRNYVQRVVDHDKSDCAKVACQFGKDYWDGDRQYGYGGYRYDGRWLPIAQKFADFYGLKKGDKVLDVGCGKGYLLYEFMIAVLGIEVRGLDISEYAIENSKEEVSPFLDVGNASSLPYQDDEFDFVISLGALHNLPIANLFEAIQEIERVGRGAKKYVMVESHRNEREKANLLYWQLTCKSFYSVEDWKWVFDQCNYSGDYGFIYFE